MEPKAPPPSQQLAEKVKTDLSAWQHRFEIYDPFAEVTFRYATSEQATGKADAFRTSRFQYRETDEVVKQVDKVEGQWWVRGQSRRYTESLAPSPEDKPLAAVQQAIDVESLRAIEERAKQRAALGKQFDVSIDHIGQKIPADKAMASVDAYAYLRIQDTELQNRAAAQVASNARQYPEYKEGLDRAIPGYPGTTSKIYVLMQDENRAVSEASTRPYESMMTEQMRAAAASLSPQNAAKQVQADLKRYNEMSAIPSHFQAENMLIKSDANPEYRKELEKRDPGLLAAATMSAKAELHAQPEKIKAAQSLTAGQVDQKIAADLAVYENAKKAGDFGYQRHHLDDMQLQVKHSEPYRAQLIEVAPKELLNQINPALAVGKEQDNRTRSAKDATQENAPTSMQEEKRALAAALSPKDAQQQAFKDVVQYRATTRDGERFFRENDIAIKAEANPHYRDALQVLAPQLLHAPQSKTLHSEEVAPINRKGQELDREEKRALAAALSPEDARKQALQDLTQFKATSHADEKFHQAANVGIKAEANPHYRDALEKLLPQDKEAQKAEFEAQAKMRKYWQSISVSRGNAAKSWSPEEARQQVNEDVAAFRARTEDPFDLKRNPYIVDNIGKHASVNPHYREALQKIDSKLAYDVSEAGKNSIFWSPEEARQQANKDIAAYRAQTQDPYIVESIAWSAKANSYYDKAVKKAAPDLEPVVAETRKKHELQQAEWLARLQAVKEVRQITSYMTALDSIDPDLVAKAQLANGKESGLKENHKQTAASHVKQPDAKAPTAKLAGNTVESDKVFTARKNEEKRVVPPEVEDRYLHVGDKFYYSDNSKKVAFEDKGNKLVTESDSHAVADSMVKIALARGWDEIKVSGTETFRKEVWLDAASRGMQVKGYSPSEQDKAELAKRMKTIEAAPPAEVKEDFRVRENPEKTMAQRMADSLVNDPPEKAVQKFPALANAVAALEAINKRAEQDGLSQHQRDIVVSRARQHLRNSIERVEQIPDVRLSEKTAARTQEHELSR